MRRIALYEHVCACALLLAACVAGLTWFVRRSADDVTAAGARRDAVVATAPTVVRPRLGSTVPGEVHLQRVLASIQRNPQDAQVLSISIDKDNVAGGSALLVTARGRYSGLKTWLSEMLVRHERLGLNRLSLVQSNESEPLAASLGFVLVDQR